MSATITPTEKEPRVLTADVRRILRRVVRPGDDDVGESVVMLAQRADTSARTVYRCLAHNSDTLSLDLADRLVIAANGHLMECRLVWPNGQVTDYYN